MAEETDAEFLERLRKEHGVGMSNTDRARLLAQGAALGFGDEVEAAVGSLSGRAQTANKSSGPASPTISSSLILALFYHHHRCQLNSIFQLRIPCRTTKVLFLV